jgi:hypothetical protein
VARHTGAVTATGADVPYVPVDGKPWRMTMGLRPLEMARWLEVDRNRAEQLRLKGQLLATRHDRVVAALPGTERAGEKVLADVVDHLQRYHPGLVTSTADGRLLEGTLGVSLDPATMHPVDAAGRLVQEDLCLMVLDGHDWILGAASVCFPSRWALTDKIGQDLSGIHGPVPGYERALGGATRAFFDRLRSDRPVWRLNWTLIDTPDLFLPGSEGRRTSRHRAQEPDAGLWFRVERQTLRRLAGSAAIVFTIRTYVASLDELFATHPEAVRALHATLSTVPPATLDYKGWSALIAPLLTRLDRLQHPGS